MIGDVIYKTAFEFGKVLTVCHLGIIPANIYIAICLFVRVLVLIFKNILTILFLSDNFL
jgi:hypothetical protein